MPYDSSALTDPQTGPRLRYLIDQLAVYEKNGQASGQHWSRKSAAKIPADIAELFANRTFAIAACAVTNRLSNDLWHRPNRFRLFRPQDEVPEVMALYRDERKIFTCDSPTMSFDHQIDLRYIQARNDGKNLFHCITTRWGKWARDSKTILHGIALLDSPDASDCRLECITFAGNGKADLLPEYRAVATYSIVRRGAMNVTFR